jgi:hypothetical protein
MCYRRLGITACKICKHGTTFYIADCFFLEFPSRRHRADSIAARA